MANITAAAAVAKVLKEEGVEWYSGVHGGHIWQLMGQISKQGIKMYHMRHEQSGVYCAEGFARTTGKPGVCFGRPDPAMAIWYPASTKPIFPGVRLFALFGQHSTAEDGWGPFQEGYAEPVTSHFTKWTRRVVEPTMAPIMSKKLSAMR